MARQLSTSNYDLDARRRLAGAVLEAREAAGYSQPSFAAAAGISPRSVSLVENAETGVGAKVLRAIGRTLPNWTKDTAQQILEGDPIPPTTVETPPVEPVAPEPKPSIRERRQQLDTRLDELLEAVRLVQNEIKELNEEERLAGGGPAKTG